MAPAATGAMAAITSCAARDSELLTRVAITTGSAGLSDLMALQVPASAKAQGDWFAVVNGNLFKCRSSKWSGTSKITFKQNGVMKILYRGDFYWGSWRRVDDDTIHLRSPTRNEDIKPILSENRRTVTIGDLVCTL